MQKIACRLERYVLVTSSRGARSQIERALESTRSVAGACPEDSLERALEHIEDAERHLFALQRESRGEGDSHCSETVA